MTMTRFITITLAATLALGLFGCYQGKPSKKPPIHLNPSMDRQPKELAYEKSEFFADASVMRQPVEGTVARGQLGQFQADPDSVAYYTGLTIDGDTVVNNPLPMTMNVLQRGQDRYNIYCAPCHSRTGDGNGMVVKRGMLRPPSFHEERIRTSRDGHIYYVITNGIRNMPTYRHQIPVEDRWKIVAYVRALQLSQHADIEDIPENIRDEVQ